MNDWFINSTIRSINVGGMNNTLSAEVKEVIQKVWYFSQMNESPTSKAVVAETLIRPELIASESEKELISISYYLATAKIALKIQLLNQSPKYDNILVNLRIFHIEMVFFSALRKCLSSLEDHTRLTNQEYQKNFDSYGLSQGKVTIATDDLIKYLLLWRYCTLGILTVDLTMLV